MSEWWAEWSTYRPSDFLMFSPRTYWRMFQLQNQATWPAPVLMVCAGMAALWALRRRQPPLRALWVGMALAWAAVGWFFLHLRYADIFWVMQGAAWLFAAQAVLMLAWAVLMPAGTHSAVTPKAATAGIRATALVLTGWAVLVHPWLAALAGRPWWQAEVLGLAPDPTVFAALGLLLCTATPRGPSRVVFEAMWLLALAWCLFSAATLWTMGSAQGAVPAAVAALALAARWAGERRAEARVSGG